MKKKTLSIITLCVVTVAASYCIAVALRPSTLNILAPEVYIEGGRFSKEHHDSMTEIVRIINTRRWTPTETEWILGWIEPGPDEPIPPEHDMPALEAFMEQDILMAGLVDRMASGHISDPRVTDKLLDTVDKMIVHPQPHARETGIAYASTLGLIQPGTPLYAHINRLRTQDPDPKVRTIADIKIRYADSGASDGPCPTCPGARP